MPRRADEGGIDKVFLDRLGMWSWKRGGFDGNVWDFVELRDDIVPVVWRNRVFGVFVVRNG